MRDIFVNKLLEIAELEKDLFFLTGDLGYGQFDALEKKLKNRYINVGVSEQNMMGVATGLAMEGKKVVTYSIGNFGFMRCLEQIRNDAAYHNCNLTIVSNGSGYSYGTLGYSHHLTEDLAIMSAIPNIKVHSPATKNDINNILDYSLSNFGVNYLRLDKSIFKNNISYKFHPTKLVTYVLGRNAHIFTTGGISELAEEAIQILKTKNINCGMSVIHTLKPLCENDILKIVKKIKNIVVLEEHSKIGGLASLISELLIRKNQYPKNFFSFNAGDHFINAVGDQKYLRNKNRLNPRNIANKIISFY